MFFTSTRNTCGTTVEYDETLLSALAADGGLYVPNSLPFLTNDAIRSFRGMSYRELAKQLLPILLGPQLHGPELSEIIDAAYEEFEHPTIAPLKNPDNDLWILELFHGPTFAFKDFALQLLCRILDNIWQRKMRKR